MGSGEGEYCDFSFEAVLLGTEGSGRSSFLARLKNNTFTSIPPTIGVECVAYSAKVRKRRVRTLFFDTSGQGRYAPARELSYTRAAGAIVFYDVTRRASFTAVRRVIAELREHANDAVVMICAAKMDENGRTVRKREGERLAEQMNALFAETSAKDDKGVDEAFAKFAQAVCEQGGPLVYCARCARKKCDHEDDCVIV